MSKRKQNKNPRHKHANGGLTAKNTTHGGIRTGAGRKPSEKREVEDELKPVSLHTRIPKYLKNILENLEGTQSGLVVNALIKTYNVKRSDTNLA